MFLPSHTDSLSTLENRFILTLSIASSENTQTNCTEETRKVVRKKQRDGRLKDIKKE